MSAPRRRHVHWEPPPPLDLELFASEIVARTMTVLGQPVESAPTYSGDLDGERLTSQLKAVLALMADQQWRTLSEIRAAIGRGSEAGISARLREIRSSRRGVVERRRRGDPKQGLWEYRLLNRFP